eukprot:gene33147-42869_t
MNLTLSNDDSLPLLIENISGASILLSDAYISSHYANRSTQPNVFFREPTKESMLDQFENKSLDELMTEFRDAVLDSNPFPLRPSFPSVYSSSSMFAVQPHCTSPTANGSRNGVIGDSSSNGDNMNGEYMGDSDRLAVFGRIHDALSPKRNRTGPKNLLELLRRAPFQCPVTNRDFSNFFEHCSDDDLGAVVGNMKVFETSPSIRSGQHKQGFLMEILPMMTSSVTHCFIVLEGSGFADTASERATVFGLTNIPEMKARSKHLLKTMKKKKISVGHVLGFDALDTPIENMASSSSGSSSSNDDESEQFRTAARTAHGDISACARVRVFPPGAKVFTQVLQGHCSLVRTVKSKGSTLIEIDAHDHDHDGTATASLLPGDFIGDITTTTTDNKNITSRELVQNRFGKHRHALVCKTRVELAALSDRRYSYLHMSDEALLQRHCEEERWTSEKKKLIRQQISSSLLPPPTSPSHGNPLSPSAFVHLLSHPAPSSQHHSPTDKRRRSSKFSSPRESKLKETYR